MSASVAYHHPVFHWLSRHCRHQAPLVSWHADCSLIMCMVFTAAEKGAEAHRRSNPEPLIGVSGLGSNGELYELYEMESLMLFPLLYTCLVQCSLISASRSGWEVGVAHGEVLTLWGQR